MRTHLNRIALLAVLTVSLSYAADPTDIVRHVTAGPEDVVPVNTATFEYSSIVLPEGEKAITYLCGDPKHWDVQIIEGAERFVNIKPSPGAHGTDIQILTDHNHNYTVKAGLQTPVDVKLFLESTDVESLRKPPTFVPALEAQRAEAEAKQAEAELERVKKQAQEQIKKNEDAFRVNYPQRLIFDYLFHGGEAPFNIHAVWHDDRFTYISAQPEETASFYELKDGKPNLVEFQYKDGLYIVRDIVDHGFLQVGKKRTDIQRRPNS
jgi:type IV secretory pathway VirB9-like protein